MLLTRIGKNELTDVNDAWIEFSGYTREEALGATLQAVGLDPDETARVRNDHALEKTVFIKDGTSRTVLTNSNMIRVGGEEFSVTCLQDITERKKNEEALRESQAMLHAALSSMTDAVFISDAEGRFVEFNHAFATFHRFKNAANCSTRLSDYPALIEVFMADGTPAPLNMWAVPRALRGETESNIEYSLRRKDTGEAWVGSYSFAPIRDAGDMIVGSVVVARDITEQKKAVAERERLAMAIRQAAEAVVVTDPAGTIQYVNPAFEAVSGYSAAETLGQNPRVLKSGEQDEAFYQNLWRTISSGETWRGVLVNKRKDGTLYSEASSISPVFGATGRIINYVAVKKDITAQQEIEEQLRQAQKMEAIGLLAGGVAHDFNNKLQIIQGYTDVALTEIPPDAPLRADLIEIRNATHNAADLTRQLLTFARKQIIEPEVLDLNRAVENMLKMLRRLIGENITLSWEPAQYPCPVKIDPTQIDQLLANLCINARDAISGSGAIRIATKIVPSAALNKLLENPTTADYIELTIADTGGGISEEILPKIFEPFFTTKEIGRGTGLGLATVYGIIRQNDGTISVESNLEEGTTFSLYMPRYAEAISDGPETKDHNCNFSGNETILLVEDAPILLALEKKMLENLGYRVFAVNHPAEARKLAKKHATEIDLLITDIILPEENGMELAKKLVHLIPALKILYTSGYTDDTIERNNIKTAGIHFIQKPFSLEHFSKKIRHILNQPSPDPR